MTHAIVLVDDEKVILDSLKSQLAACFRDQFVYETAESVAEAWEVIDELVGDDSRIIVIVSDWLMPGTKGDEFLVEISERYPEIRTVLLTGHADAAAVKRAVQDARVERVLYKPWSAQDLQEIVVAARDSLPPG